jgi:ABC-2 type transport system ATP-binding protein
MLVYDYLNYIADIRGVPEAEKLPHIKGLADLCSLNEVMHKNVNQLSKGYRQRVGIAHALMGNPEILVLDEPTVGLDPNQIVDTREIIKRIGKEKTIIFSTHILSEAVATCDRFIIINKGKLVADLTIDQLKELTKQQSFEELFRSLTRGDNK